MGSIERAVVDSGAAVSVCPLGYAPEIRLSNRSRCATLRTASGAQMEHSGQKTVEYENGEGGSVNVNIRGLARAPVIRGYDRRSEGGRRSKRAHGGDNSERTWSR